MTKKATDVFQQIDMSGGSNACWPWKGPLATNDSRPYFKYNNKRVIAYRLVYELVHGVTLTSDQFVRHKCDNGASGICCCNPAHLELGTNQDNMNDMKERERHGLPHVTVRAIKKLLASATKTHQEIADLFGLTRSAVTNIANGRSYKHVPIGDEEDNVPS